MKDYHLSGYQLERFESSYPKSEKAEEALFLSAKSYYMLSPVYSKEQKETKVAIEKLQLFINKFPNSQYLAEANTLVKELDFKLEQKAFEIAKQYNTTAYYESSDYEAAIKAFENSEEWHTKRNGEYAERRKIIEEILTHLDFEFDPKQVGLFLWAKPKDISIANDVPAFVYYRVSHDPQLLFCAILGLNRFQMP